MKNFEEFVTIIDSMSDTHIKKIYEDKLNDINTNRHSLSDMEYVALVNAALVGSSKSFTIDVLQKYHEWVNS
jgi:hypothetical protein